MSEPIQALFFRDFPNAHIPEILDEIWSKGIYNPYVIGKKDLMVVDLGANIGMTCQFFYPFAKQIYAVEPTKEHQEILKKFIEFNNYTNIQLCSYAISNTNGKEKFNHNPNSTANSLELEDGSGDFEEVEVLDMEKFMEKEKIDYIDILKLDVEGSESKIISSEAFKKMCPKIKVILGEWHDWTPMRKELFQYTLEDLGYTFTWNHNTAATTFSAVRV